MDERSISRSVGRRMSEIRESRRWRVKDMAECAGLRPSEIYKLESNAKLAADPSDDPDDVTRRRVTVAHLLAVAYSLHVNPLDLFLPLVDDEPVEVVAGHSYSAWLVRSWISGNGPLDDDPEHAVWYFGEAPQHVRLRHISFQHPQLRPLHLAISDLQGTLRGVASLLDEDETPHLDDRAGLVDALRRAARSVARQTETLAAELEDQPSAGAHRGITAPRRDDRRQP